MQNAKLRKDCKVPLAMYLASYTAKSQSSVVYVVQELLTIIMNRCKMAMYLTMYHIGHIVSSKYPRKPILIADYLKAKGTH